MKFGVLGPLTVAGPEGEVRLRGEHQRALLAMLLFHANRPVTTDLLVGALWPELPPKSYASNLHTYVSRLRVRLPGVRIDLAGRGYRLQVATEDVDLLVFREAAAAGRSAARAGQPEKAATFFRKALAQWRGHPLTDMHVPVLDAELGRLESERMAVFEDCVDAELAAGRHAEVAAELQAALAENPLRERLAGQLMLALQHSGRQAEALEVYRNTRATLIDELGVEPGTALRRLHTSMLQGDGDDAPLPRPTWPICQLPAVAADFSGREQQLAEVTGLLNPGGHGVPVVVLSGEPGAGKTSLSIGAAHQVRSVFPDGQLFVPLSGVDSPRDTGAVLADLLRGLGVSGPAIPDDLQARAATYRGMLTDRKVLVVLDDAADPAQVRPLLPGTPGCAVLITSRKRLSGLAGASRLTVGPLTGDEALRLLERLVGRARVSAERADAVRIADACGNLPLALRIAGTRLALRPNLRLGLLADRLEDEGRRLDELEVSDLQVRASLTLSYAALEKTSQVALRRLGLINTVDLPEWRITTLLDTHPAEGVVEDLVESGLLEPTGTDETGEPRYRLHDLVRVFALERARMEDSARERYTGARTIIDAIIGIADVAARKLPWTIPLPRLHGPIPTQPLVPELVERLTANPAAWFAAERANLLNGIPKMTALGWHTDSILLMDRLSVYLWAEGLYADMRVAYQSIADAADKQNPRVAARARSVLALLWHARGQYEKAVDEYRTCAVELAELGEDEALAWVRTNLAACLIAVGKSDESIELTTAAWQELRDDPFAGGSVLRTQIAALNRLGRTEESAGFEAEALDLAKSFGEPRQLAMALHDKAWGCVLGEGNLEKAHELAQEAIALLRSVGSRSSLAKALRTMGAVLAGLGKREESVRAFREARDIARELTERPRELSCTRAIAAAWIGDGRAGEAITVLSECLETYREMGSTSATTITLNLLAAAYDSQNDVVAAKEARAEAERLGDPRDTNTAILLKLLLNLTFATP
ncbi:AfsR/SARP family transcriptional regulator [Kibdelosporangium aridum]|uniref:DNA-binding transcriptional activator of the SARP family n=1 Tax=Kibdelosporangium aridum TaxID=2030 RepID=A0A1W2EVP7_KIBAR|nr:BTAD domain-containing putative transcriptional regulator [Kibdelosporangium aridum]SMD13745.1 DNA-binding transcriptional activator of the SARP family [Kibdelosporangium aridum]